MVFIESFSVFWEKREKQNKESCRFHADAPNSWRKCWRRTVHVIPLM